MHRESGYDSEVDPIVKLIWSKVCITISITNLTTIVAKVCRGSYRGVPGTIKGVQGKLSRCTWHPQLLPSLYHKFLNSTALVLVHHHKGDNDQGP